MYNNDIFPIVSIQFDEEEKTFYIFPTHFMLNQWNGMLKVVHSFFFIKLFMMPLSEYSISTP